MSNLAAFYNVVRRAQTKADNAVSLLENVPITTNASIILFAAKHIEMMEEQQAKMQAELDTLRYLTKTMSENGVTISTGNHVSINGDIKIEGEVSLK